MVSSVSSSDQRMGLAEPQKTLVAPFEPVVVTQPARIGIAAVSISASFIRPLDSTVGIGFVLLDLAGGAAALPTAIGDGNGAGGENRQRSLEAEEAEGEHGGGEDGSGEQRVRPVPAEQQRDHQAPRGRNRGEEPQGCEESGEHHAAASAGSAGLSLAAVPSWGGLRSSASARASALLLAHMR